MPHSFLTIHTYGILPRLGHNCNPFVKIFPSSFAGRRPAGTCPYGTYFLLVQKVGKDTLRGQSAGWTRPKGRARSIGRSTP